MSTTTSPLTGNGAGAARAGALAPATAPMAAGAAQAPAEMVAAVQSGIATQYWDELIPLPAGNPQRLWFLVDNTWRSLDNPTSTQRDMVQRAFLGSGSVVRVWHDGAQVVGLVVSG
jgi:hypothetical protein